MSKKTLTVICIILAVALLGVGVYAAASYGSHDDPLITKSYVDGVLIPQLEQQFKTELEAQMPDTPALQGDYVELKLGLNQVVNCGVGCEIILREGSGLTFGSAATAMVDTTGGVGLQSGGYLMVNHLYVVCTENGGFKATSEVTRVLIKGQYTVS